MAKQERSINLQNESEDFDLAKVSLYAKYSLSSKVIETSEYEWDFIKSDLSDEQVEFMANMLIHGIRFLPVKVDIKKLLDRYIVPKNDRTLFVKSAHKIKCYPKQDLASMLGDGTKDLYAASIISKKMLCYKLKNNRQKYIIGEEMYYEFNFTKSIYWGLTNIETWQDNNGNHFNSKGKITSVLRMLNNVLNKTVANEKKYGKPC
jgi:hypothetical protein